ncbi:osmoprotectant transport system permease protein [Naumannella cuiyingiana]|uniref:Osmoprotectant transport system permease protein n=1 Tax=Naumannella cuiyingiana TaxID=1347891 RepID=A0A7Z0D8K8_9ACTN|nr:ABC transporter permease subunit [Naumannella cuiyingiana]NYI70764.1 osmoprotectant transport system permease protein [Naumannella cuiyingiana]
MSLWPYLTDPANWSGAGGIGDLLAQHLVYTFLALLVAGLIAVPAGIAIGHTGRGDFVVAGLSNAARAIPTLGLLVLIVTIFGRELWAIVAALAVLAIPPILTATAAGVRGADRGAVTAAHAMGMTDRQVITGVELPLATPLIISGFRSAALQVVATATVAALAASGGLGRLVVDGQRQGPNGYPEVFAGAVLVAALAIILEALLGGAGALARRRTRRGARA